MWKHYNALSSRRPILNENNVHRCQNCPALFIAICTAGLNCFDEDLWEIHYIIEYKFTTRTFVLFPVFDWNYTAQVCGVCALWYEHWILDFRVRPSLGFLFSFCQSTSLSNLRTWTWVWSPATAVDHDSMVMTFSSVSFLMFVFLLNLLREGN